MPPLAPRVRRRLLATVFLLLTVSLPGRTLYVATDGDNSSADPTDPATPLRTIQQAASIAQPGDDIVIREGAYRDTVVVPNNGEDGAPITFRPFAEEQVTVSGANLITSAWTPVPGTTGTIYVTSYAWSFPTRMNQERQLFVDGVMMIEARHPNLPGNGLDPLMPDYFRFDATGIDDQDDWVTLYTFTDAEAVALTNLRGEPINPVDADIWYYPRHGEGNAWGFTQSGVVASYIPNSGEMTFLGPDLDSNHFGPGDQYHLGGLAAGESVQAKIAMLDAPGEWVYDIRNQLLYLYPPDGQDPNTLTVEGKARDFAFNLSRRSHIVLQDLDIFAATVTTDTDAGNKGVGNGETWVGRYNEVDRTTDWPEAHHITIDGLHFRYVNHFDDLTGWQQGQWTQASGIIVSGMHMTIRNCLVEWAAGNGIMLLGNDILCANNIVHSTNYVGTLGAGISSALKWRKERVRIMHNTVWRTGFDGITSQENASRDGLSEVGYNRIASWGMLTEDTGGIKQVGHAPLEGTRWHHNILSDTDTYDIALYLDFATAHLVDHNIVYHVAEAINTNNAKYHHIYHNTLQSYRNDNRVVGGREPAEILYVKNNLGIARGFDDHELFIYAANLVVNDPYSLFVDHQRGDFRLTAAAAAAINSAVPIPDGPDPDNQGVVLDPVTEPARVVGPAPDVGALEFGGADWTDLVGSSLPLPWATPSDLKAGRTPSGSVALTWQDHADNEETYIVERGIERPNGDRVYTVIAILPADTTAYVDQEAACMGYQHFHYRVRADYSMFTNTVLVPPPSLGLRLAFNGDLEDTAPFDLASNTALYEENSTAMAPPFVDDAPEGTGALAFDAAQKSRVLIADAPDINPRLQTSILLWIKPNRWSNEETIFARAGSYRLQSLFGSLRLALSATGTTPVIRPEQIPLGEWSHLAFVYDGTTIKAYLNGGNPDGTSLEPRLFRTTRRNMSAEGALAIGGPVDLAQPATAFFAGAIDDFRIYHRALTGDEVRTAMRTGPAELTITQVTPGNDMLTVQAAADPGLRPITLERVWPVSSPPAAWPTEEMRPGIYEATVPFAPGEPFFLRALWTKDNP